MNFKKLATNYKNINQGIYKSSVSEPTRFYCANRGCVIRKRGGMSGIGIVHLP